MRNWQYTKLDKGERVYVAEGKHKGRYGVAGYKDKSKIEITLDGPEPLTINVAYKTVETLDEFGQPQFLPVTDMSGRPLEISNYICYSVASGRNSHAMEIGRITEISAVGALKVEPIVHNGAKLTDTYWKREKNVNEPLRCLKIPVESNEVIYWIMQDFDEMAKAKRAAI